MAEPWDIVSPIRNNYYLGNYVECLKDSKILMDKKNNNLNNMPDIYYYRIYLEYKNYDIIFKSINKNSSYNLQIVKLYAKYKQANNENKDMVLNELAEILNEDALNDENVKYLAGSMYYEAKDYKNALKLVHDGENLELMSLAVLIYLALNRVDLAERQVKAMMDSDEEDVLTVFSAVWVYLAIGGEKVQESYLSLQELVEKYGPTISNTLAVCLMAKKNYAEALEALKEAKEMCASNNISAAETLSNTILCYLHLHKHAEAEVTEKELAKLDPNHAWFLKAKEAEHAINAISL